MATAMLLHGALESLEQLINPVLMRDAVTRRSLAAMTGDSVRVHCTQPDVAFVVRVSGEGLHLERDHGAETDAGIEGPLNSFLRFMLAGDRREALLFEGALTLRGDTGRVHRLQRILSSLDADLISAVEARFGVMPTALFRAPLSLFSRFKTQVGRSATADWQEYLQHELALLPAQSEQQYFSREILALRRDLERTEARIQLLQRMLNRLETPASDISSDPS